MSHGIGVWGDSDKNEQLLATKLHIPSALGAHADHPACQHQGQEVLLPLLLPPGRAKVLSG